MCLKAEHRANRQGRRDGCKTIEDKAASLVHGGGVIRETPYIEMKIILAGLSQLKVCI